MPAVLQRAGLILLLCVGLLVAGCGGDDSDDSAATSTETTAEAPANDAKSIESREKPKVKPPQGAPPKQLEEKTLIPGTGPEAKKGDQVTVNYVGVGYETGLEFDSSWDRNEPFSFGLGNGEVIRGWDVGIEGMKVGERRELIIPPDLAYGSEGAGTIAPNATLVFVVDLIEVS
jgi:peptidylprolyl isomerase